MISEKEAKVLAQYWLATAEHDYKTMSGLFRIKRYSDALFFGHLVLEKILKAFVARQTKEQAPKTHNLIRLMELAKIDLTESQMDVLSKANQFNLRTRYPDAKLRFYKIATKEYAKKNLIPIKKLYKELCQELTQKK